MNKLFIKILIASVALIGAGIFAVPSVSAQPPENLIVQFEQTPLFNETNILPGDVIPRWVIVVNNNYETHKIAVRAENVTNPDNFGSMFDFNIKEGTTTLYSGSLESFFNAGEIYLSTLVGRVQTQYDFTATFESDAGNDYQQKGLKFDIAIGFQGEEGTFRTQGVGGGGESYLIIYDESVSGVGDTFATITWKTRSSAGYDYPASSQVIFGTAGESHTINLGDNSGVPPKYGYTYTTSESDTTPNVITHTVTLTGLTPGTTYFARAVSRSGLAISTELTFTTLGVAGAEEIIPASATQGAETITAPSGTPSGGEVGGVSEEKPLEEIKGLMAAIGDAFKGNLCGLLLFIIIILMVLFLLSILRKKRDKKKEWILPLLTAILIIIYCLFCCSKCGSFFCCKICWILLIIDAALYLTSLFIGKKGGENKKTEV